MGLLVPIDADRPFASVAELEALVRGYEEPYVHLELETADVDLVLRVVSHGTDPTRVGFTAHASAARTIAAYARTRTAGYVDARHAGGCLRVWRDNAWVDGLASDPHAGTVTQRVLNGRQLYDVRDIDVDTAIALWLAAVADDRIATYAAAPSAEQLESYVRAARGPIQVRARVEVGVAAAIAVDHPALEMTWASGALNIELPERTARFWWLSPVSAEQLADARAHFTRCRRDVSSSTD